MTKEEKEYKIKYDGAFSEKEKNIELLKNILPYDEEKFNKYKEDALALKWEEIKINIDMIPRPTPRGRYSSRLGGFYVKRAKANHKKIEKLLDNLKIIYTKTKFQVVVYQPTPTSMKYEEIILAEEGIVQPLSDPDWDNLGKTYSDMLQGYLIMNDNIIVNGIVEKYYSIKPRIEIIINYQMGFDCDYNKNKILSSKLYQEIF